MEAKLQWKAEKEPEAVLHSASRRVRCLLSNRLWREDTKLLFQLIAEKQNTVNIFPDPASLPAIEPSIIYRKVPGINLIIKISANRKDVQT